MNKLKIILCTIILASSFLAYTVTGAIDFDKEKYFTGEAINLELTLRNHAFTDVENVEVTINVPSGLGSEISKEFKLLSRAEETEKFKIKIPPATISKKYEFSGTIRYEDEVYELESQSIDIEKNPLLIETSFSENILKLSITNAGEEDITGIDIDFGLSDSLKTESDETYKISKLAEGEEWTKAIKIKEGSSNGFAEISIEYEDSDLIAHKYEETISVPVSTDLIGGSTPPISVEWILAIIIVVVTLKMFVFKK